MILNQNTKIAIIGAGIMGRGIAQVAAKANHRVILYDTKEEALESATIANEKDFKFLVKKGKISEEDKNKAMANISTTSILEDLSSCDLAIEAIIENLEIKQTLFANLQNLNPNMILASNTSSISISAIASNLKKPQNLLGVHFFNPATIMKLVEIINGLQSDTDMVKSVFNLISSWGKKCVYVKSYPGFIVNRVARAFYAESLRLYEEGVSNFETLDESIKQGGHFRMGAFELMDLIGNDTNYLVTNSMFNSYYQDDRFKPSITQYEYVCANLLGRKTNKGFYDYKDGVIQKNNLEYISYDKNAKQEKVLVCGDVSIANELISLLEEKNIEIIKKDNDLSSVVGYISYKNAKLFLANGKMATEISSHNKEKNILQLDICLDYKTSHTLTISSSLLADGDAISTFAELFSIIDKKVISIKDSPAMISLRTISMLINEASSTVSNKVCDEQSIDTAMKNALNHKIGPFEWLNKLGEKYIFDTLNSLEDFYKDGRYRVDRGLIEKILTRSLNE